MKNKLWNIKIIGYLLAALYAASLGWFLFYVKIPDMRFKSYIYVGLFALLFVGSIAVVMLKEWGRKIVVLSNAILFVILFLFYIHQVDPVLLSYFIMSIIVLMYFNQTKVKIQFMRKKIDVWRSILIVDDDISIIKVVRPILMANGFSVLHATSGEEGLNVAKAQKPDLILLDVIMPGIKGREVCKQLKTDEETKHIPVIFLTSKDSSDDVKAELEAGAETHLTKPVNAKILISTIKNTLGKHNL